MKEKLLYISFLLALPLSIIGALFKIQHWPHASLMLSAGIIAFAFFILLSLYEILRSDKIKSGEKVMWTVGFLFMGLLTGIVYMVLGRKRIA